MSVIDKYMTLAYNIACNDIHGYSMENRWGPDYDCSSLVIYCVDNVGVNVKSLGASYTGNMYNAFIRAGFEDVTRLVNLKTGDGLEYGDVLLNTEHHTELYYKNKTTIGAHWNYDGKTGDGNGQEINIAPYRNYPWDYVLRYHDKEKDIEYTYSLDDLKMALRVINGEMGDGQERQIKLVQAGYDPCKIQSAVNVIYTWFAY